jgi:TAT-translocated FGD2 family F420-dependent dehydrogenase
MTGSIAAICTILTRQGVRVFQPNTRAARNISIHPEHSSRRIDMTVRIGFVLSHEQFPAPQLIELGVAAEQAGFDELWTSDHFHPWQDNQGHAGQAWITLAALGERTRSIPFGTGVTCPLFRYRPAIVAQAFASLALLSPGRVFLGLGTGEALNEVPAGGGWDDPRGRLERLTEATALIRQLWSGDWVTHRGRYYHVEKARIYDPPPLAVPIYLAASGRRTARAAGEVGDGWINLGEGLGRPEIREAFREGARSAGKHPDRLPVLVESFVIVGGTPEAEEAARLWRFMQLGPANLLDKPDPREIQRLAEERVALEDVYRDWVVSEDPQVHIEAIHKLVDRHGRIAG